MAETHFLLLLRYDIVLRQLNHTKPDGLPANQNNDMHSKPRTFLVINSRDELFRFDVENIVYFEAEGNYSNIILANGHKASVSMNLSQMQNVISKSLGEKAAHFARVGRKHIINLNYVQAIMTLQQRTILSDGLHFTYSLQISKDALRKLRDLYIRTLAAQRAAATPQNQTNLN